jgi:bacterioferritin
MSNNTVIDLLNDARARELTAIGTYMIQHYELEDKGYGKLASEMKQIAIKEMKHAETLAERILFLGGVPVTKPDAEIRRSMPIKEMIEFDISLEQTAIEFYNEAANACGEQKDNVSKSVFESLLADEEEHVDEFQKILDHINELGDAYLATLVSG